MLDWSLSAAAMSSRARPLRPATLSGFTRTIAASSLTARVQAVVAVTAAFPFPSDLLEAARARKPILIEKPLAPTGLERGEMVRAAESSGIPLMTAQTLRLMLPCCAEGAAFDRRPRQYLVLTNRVEPRPEVTRNPTDYAGRGVLLEIGIHQLDLIRFLTGEEVAEGAL